MEVPSAQTIGLVHAGHGEASTPAEPLLSSSIAAGKGQADPQHGRAGNKDSNSVYVATEDFIAKNPDTVKNFAASVYAAAKDVNGNRELAAKVAQSEHEVHARTLNNAFYQTFAVAATTPAQIDKISDLAVKYGILTEQSPRPRTSSLIPNERNDPQK